MLGSEVCLPHLQHPPLSELTHTQQLANITYYTHLWLGTAWSFHASLCGSWHLALFYQQQVAPALRSVSLPAQMFQVCFVPVEIVGQASVCVHAPLKSIIGDLRPGSPFLQLKCYFFLPLPPHCQQAVSSSPHGSRPAAVKWRKMNFHNPLKHEKIVSLLGFNCYSSPPTPKLFPV